MSNPLTLLDAETPAPDPLAGTRVGTCEVVGSLVPGGRALLAFKLDLGGASETVLLHKLDESGPPPPSVLADAEEATGLKDSHLERVFGIETSPLGSYWVTEYVPGATLDEVRTACKAAGTPFPMGFGLAAVADAALGLQQLHARQSARDALRPRAHGLLRPQHIVVTFAGSAKLLNPRYLKLPAHAPSDSEWFAGNAGYLAPEAINGAPVDARSDVFSLAVLVHELLTNKQLFGGRTPKERAEATLRGAQVPPSKLNLSLSATVDAAVMKALSLDPNQRHPNAGEFHKALKQTIGPYMWKESQRAELMERVFGTRSRQTALLAIRMKEREAAAIARVEEEKRAAEQARADEAAAKAAAEEAARVAQQQAAEAARVAAQKAAAQATANAAAAAAAAKAAAKAEKKPLPMPVIALAGVPTVLLLGVVGWLVFRSPPPPPPVVVPTPPVAVVTPPAVVDAGSDTNDAGSMTDGGAEGVDAGAPDAGAPKKKKKSNDVPLPPWLRR